MSAVSAANVIVNIERAGSPSTDSTASSDSISSIQAYALSSFQNSPPASDLDGKETLVFGGMSIAADNDDNDVEDDNEYRGVALAGLQGTPNAGRNSPWFGRYEGREMSRIRFTYRRDATPTPTPPTSPKTTLASPKVTPASPKATPTPHSPSPRIASPKVGVLDPVAADIGRALPRPKCRPHMHIDLSDVPKFAFPPQGLGLGLPSTHAFSLRGARSISAPDNLAALRDLPLPCLQALSPPPKCASPSSPRMPRPTVRSPTCGVYAPVPPPMTRMKSYYDVPPFPPLERQNACYGLSPSTSPLLRPPTPRLYPTILTTLPTPTAADSWSGALMQIVLWAPTKSPRDGSHAFLELARRANARSMTRQRSVSAPPALEPTAAAIQEQMEAINALVDYEEPEEGDVEDEEEDWGPFVEVSLVDDAVPAQEIASDSVVSGV